VRGVSVVIEGTEKNKADGRSDADGDEKFAAALWLPTQHIAEAIASGHDEDPGDERVVEDYKSAMKREPGDLMKCVPEESKAAEACGVNAVKQIVGGDDEQAERGQDAYRKVSKPREKNHAQAEHPEDQKKDERALQPNLEHPEEADDGDFQEYEPKAASKEEARELRFSTAVPFVEEGANASRESENGRTEMGDPASEEQHRRGTGEVGWSIQRGIAMDEIAHVVERHDDHDEAAKSIHGL